LHEPGNDALGLSWDEGGESGPIESSRSRALSESPGKAVPSGTRGRPRGQTPVRLPSRHGPML
jgi:hypothetical protein